MLSQKALSKQRNPHAYVRVDSSLNVMFLFNPGVYSDYPLLHRFLGPATYSITAEGIKDLRWYIRGKEYTEYDYWDLMCSLFSDRLQLTLSMDETRYWTEASELGLPFPSRLNMSIKNLGDTEDDERTQLAAHPVWSINGEYYVSAEKFWNSWERKSNDIVKLLL